MDALILKQIKDKENRAIYTEFIAILFNQYPSIKGSISIDFHTLDKVMTLQEVDAMAFQLTLQLQALEARGFSMLLWQPCDILVVRATPPLYILASMAQRVPLHQKDLKQFVMVYPTIYPLPRERCAPELLTIDALPFITPRSASYYSLALLCLCQLNLSLEAIRGTKLFYFLERCLKEEPGERMLLYI